MRRFFLRLRNAFCPSKSEQELERELTAHLRLIEDEYRRQGLTEHEAHTAAKRALGVEQAKELHREARTFPLLDQVRNDLIYAARTLQKSPGFSWTAVFILAIGIGAATTVFSELNAVFFRQLPVSRPEDLRSIVWASPKRGFLNTPAVAGPTLTAGESFASYPYPFYKAIRDNSGAAFSDLACWMDPGEVLPVVMGALGFGSVQFVSGNYFQTLGVNAYLGRTIQSTDDLENTPAPIAVLSHRFWHRAFGADPNVLSKTINLNGNAFTIVGVLPEEFFGLDPSISPDVMVPISMLHIASAGGVPAIRASRTDPLLALRYE